MLVQHLPPPCHTRHCFEHVYYLCPRKTAVAAPEKECIRRTDLRCEWRLSNLLASGFSNAFFSGVGSGFRFEGKEGKGTQTVTAVSPNSVTHLIDLGAMGKPVQTIRAEETATGSRVTWTVTSDMGFNPIFRIFGLFMDRMLGKTYERGLSNIAALSCSSNDTPCGAPSGAPFAFARWLSSLRRAAIASSGRFRVQRVCSASAAGLGPSKPYPQEPYRPSP